MRIDKRLIILAFFFFTQLAMATNGYFQIGYGTRSTAMGGATSALPQDGMIAAVNPAGIHRVAEGWEIGGRLFRPDRSAEINCAGRAACNRTIEDTSERDYFLIPDFSYARRINPKWSFAAVLYGNGGMNTHYSRNIFDETFAALQNAPEGSGTGFPNTDGHLGVDLSQMIIAPTFSYAPNDKQSFGVSLLLGVQRFSADGLGNFAGISSDARNLTNNGHDLAYGGGIRVGWLTAIHPNIQISASYSSKVYMTKFDDYRGLFSDDGSFDIPAHLTLGLAYAANNQLTIAADIQRIYYSDIPSINNSGPSPIELTPNGVTPNRQLGADQGIGFGWENIWVAKLGLRYKASPQWTVRAGINHGEKPFSDNEALINILAPGTVTSHLNFGVSMKINNSSELSFSYTYAFNQSQKDNDTALLGSSARVELSENALGLSYRKTLAE